MEDQRQIDMAEYYLAIVMKNLILNERKQNQGSIREEDMPALI